MFNLNVDNLGARIYFIRKNWGLNTAVRHLLQHAYETFQMDVGLDGNIFGRNFDALGYLAEHSWFKVT